DHVLVLEILDLLFRQPAGLDQLVEERMVGGGGMQLAAAIDVAARVADPAEPGLLVADEAADERRPHSALARGVVLRISRFAVAPHVGRACELERHGASLADPPGALARRFPRPCRIAPKVCSS